MLQQLVTRAHVLAMTPEPLCDGCYFRCSACAYFWDDEDFLEDGGSPTAILQRDAAARLELGIELEPKHVAALGGSSGEASNGAEESETETQESGSRSGSPALFVAAGEGQADAARASFESSP